MRLLLDLEQISIVEPLTTERSDIDKKTGISAHDAPTINSVAVQNVTCADIDDLEPFLEYEDSFQCMNSISGLLKRALTTDFGEPKGHIKSETLSELINHINSFLDDSRDSKDLISNYEINANI